METWNIDNVTEECKKIDLKDGFFPKIHQIEGLCFMLNKQEKGLGYILAHDMGLGKTLQALLLVKISEKLIGRGTTLVLCPPQCSDIWIKEAINIFERPPSMLLCKGNSEWISYRTKNNRLISIKIRDSDHITRNMIKKHDIVISHYQALTSIWKRKIVDKVKRTLEVHAKTKKRKKTEQQTICENNNIVLTAMFPGLAWNPNNRVNSKILDAEIIPSRCDEDLGSILSFDYNRLIVDEAHNMKNPKTLLATMSFAIRAKYRLCLTGTPKVNYDQDTWSLFHFLRVPELVSFEEFKDKSKRILELQKKYSIPQDSRRTMGRDSNCIETNSSKRYIEKLYAQYMHVVTKSEIDNQYSERIITSDPRSLVEKCIIAPSSTIGHGIYERTIMVDMNACTLEAYEAIRLARLSTEKNADAEDSASEDDSMRSREKNKKIYAFATINILRQMTSDPTICRDHMMNYCDADLVKNVMRETPSKFRALLDYINNNVYADEKVAIFCYFKKACRNLAKYLRDNGQTGIQVITGDNTKDQKNNAIDELRENVESRIIIATMCLTEGVNMTTANHCIIFTPWWNDAKERQTVGRLHRIGQMRDVHMIYFIHSSSIEEKIRYIAMTKGKIPSTREIMLILGISARTDQEYMFIKKYDTMMEEVHAKLRDEREREEDAVIDTDIYLQDDNRHPSLSRDDNINRNKTNGDELRIDMSNNPLKQEPSGNTMPAKYLAMTSNLLNSIPEIRDDKKRKQMQLIPICQLEYYRDVISSPEKRQKTSILPYFSNEKYSLDHLKVMGTLTNLRDYKNYNNIIWDKYIVS